MRSIDFICSECGTNTTDSTLCPRHPSSPQWEMTKQPKCCKCGENGSTDFDGDVFCIDCYLELPLQNDGNP